MQNTTLMYLHVISMTSMSPYLTLRNQYNGIHKLSLVLCHFSHFFSSTLIAFNSNHQTMIRNTVFSHSLSTPLKFISSECAISSDRSSAISMPIVNKTIAPFNFSGSDELKNKHAYFKSGCGDISIHFCSFIDCYSSNEPGGSLWINQDCTAVIHGTIFSGSHTTKNRGGACCIAKNIDINSDDIKDDPKDERISSLNIQYCCFSDCYPDGKNDTLYGLALFIAAEDAVFYFSSTINCPPKDKPYRSKGAQVDIQAENVKSKNINITGGRSKFCAGIEYRYATMGHFMFQTISQIGECMFATSLTNVNISGLTLSYSNYDNNRLINNADESDVNLYPALIHVRFKKVEISHFCFTNFIDESNLKNAKIISRGTYYYTLNDGTRINSEQEVIITLNNCFRDDTINDDQIGTKYVEAMQMLFGTVICDEKIKTNGIPHLFLGHCEGDVAPDEEIKIEDVNEPSPSHAFSFSNRFSDSSHFTKSDKFIYATGKFTNSYEFTKSNPFNATGKFTNSYEFTKSNPFNATSKFTLSNKFSESEEFRLTQEFTKTNVFKDSSLFEPTEEFTKSNIFTRTDHFSFLSKFSSSQLFTGSKSLVFTISETFKPKSDIVIHINKGENNQMKSNAIKIVIGVSVVGVLIIAAIIAFFVLKKKKLTSDIFENETITMADDNTTSVYTKNPLIDLLDEDDPFEDEFK